MVAPKKQQAANLEDLSAREKKEPIASFLGMRLVELSPGYARIVMKLKPEYRNFNGVVFGGIITSLADQAFAYASNSVSLPSLGSQFSINFIASPAADDELTAEGRVVHSGRRAGVTEISVNNQDGKLIARATGTSIPV